MSWVVLLFAGLFEVAWATGLKYSEGFTKLYPSIFTIIAMFISFFLLSMAMKSLPLGTSYTIWTGIGAVGAVLVGIFVFGDSVSVQKIACMCLIVSGIVGLKMAS